MRNTTNIQNNSRNNRRENVGIGHNHISQTNNTINDLILEYNRLRENIDNLNNRIENINPMTLHSIISNIRYINDDIENIINPNYSFPANPMSLMSTQSIMSSMPQLGDLNNMLFGGNTFSQNGTFEIRTSISTISPGDLPDTLLNAMNNIMSNPLIGNLGIQEDVIVPLPMECKRAMQSKRYKIKKHKNTEEIVCAICYEEFKHNERYRELPCKHEFHKRCIDTWFETSVYCPMCRQDIRELLNEKT